MYSPVAIANYFIKKAKESGITDLTPIKLIKLVFIAQGTSLAINDRILFRSPIEAWQYGPVIPELYQTFKHYKNQPIASYAGQPIIDEQGNISPLLPHDNDLVSLLDSVWETFGSWTGIDLSAWTHREGSAWDIVYNQLGGCEEPHIEIDPWLIKEEFEGVVDQSS